MTPIPIVTQAAGQAPHVFWASDTHVVAASARLEGEGWLAIRAEIAKAEPLPPDDVVFE